MTHSSMDPLLKTLFAGLSGHLAVFTNRVSKTPRKTMLVHARTTYLLYPEQAAEATALVTRAARRGREAHLCPHLLTRPERTKSNASQIGALWADADKAILPDGFPEPTLVVQSSPEHRHMYWSIRHPLPPEVAETLNRRLSKAIGADMGGWPLAALMRAPGSPNLKHPEARTVAVVANDPTLRYHPREIEQYLPPENEEGRPSEALLDIERLGRRMAATGYAARSVANPDLSELSPRMRELILHGNAAVGHPYKSRSEADFAAALAMLSKHFEPEAVWRVLSDPSNAISERFRQKGQHGPRYLARTITKAAAIAEPGKPNSGAA